MVQYSNHCALKSNVGWSISALTIPYEIKFKTRNMMRVSDYGMLTTVTHTVFVQISVSWGG